MVGQMSEIITLLEKWHDNNSTLTIWFDLQMWQIIHRMIVIVAASTSETLVKPLLHCQQTIVCVMKGFHTFSGGEQAGQKHYTPNTPCFCLRYERRSWKLTASACRGNLQSYAWMCPSHLWGCALETEVLKVCFCVCQPRVRVDGGLLKSFRYSLRRSSIILKQERGWRYAVFTCKGVLLIIRDENEPRVWRHLHLSLRRPELLGFVFFFIADSNSDWRKWHFNDPVMIHIRNISSCLTQSQLSLYAWEFVQKTQMNGCPEDVQFHISVQTFLWKFNAALSPRKVSTLSHGWVVLSE